MANAISFSLFGYKGDLSDGYPFASYMRGLSFNLKMAEIIYPSWRVHLFVDRTTYEAFKPYFDYHVEGERLDLFIDEPSQLCEMMLHRMIPVFLKYDRVLCRDVDSLLSYRERQAVEYWISTGRVVHAMTDSVSHTVALMGGMIGFMCKEFRDIIGAHSYSEFLNLGRNQKIDYNKKGADQEFLNRVIHPKIAHTMVEHYLLGMPNSFRGEYHNTIKDIPLADIPESARESNHLIFHLGQSGFAHEAALKFFDHMFTEERKEYYANIENQYKQIHYWANDNI